MSTRIYHNPSCTKSRETLKLLEARTDLNLEIITYLDTPPDATSLLAICEQLGKQPVELLRHWEAPFKELNLSLDDDRSAADWCKIMVENPLLIERPIVLHAGKAAIGRPPETVLAIL
jgi:arsenate reductase